MCAFRVDVYTNPHKDLRKLMFELSLTAAHAKSEAEIAQVITSAQALFDELHHHAHAEDTYLHPMVKPKVGQVLDALETHHHEQDEALAGLKITINKLSSVELGHQERIVEMGQFYHTLNNFIGHYLVHLAQEEDLLPLYWQECQPYELFAIMVAFKSNEEPESFPMIMQLVNQHLTEQQKITMFVVMHERLLTCKFTIAFEMAKSMLTENTISQIKKDLGILA